MERIKRYVLRNFEQVFVLTILLTVAIINYYIPQKIAFLNFYFLPVILAGYFLDLHRTVIGAVLCILLVSIYTILFPKLFVMPDNWINLSLHIAVWGGFLILSGYVVGKQQDKLNTKIKQTVELNKQLQQQQEALNKANLELTDYSKTLESRVKNRTENLEKSKEAIEALKAKVEETLYSTMDSKVVKLIIEGRLRNEKRKISVMFSDLVNFTNYSEERSPELVVRDLNRYLNDMEPVLLNYRAHIDKYMGDGIMCEFGAPVDYENYRLLAVLAALKLQEKMTRLEYPWKMRIGISSGASIIGLIGSKRQSYTTIGDMVNLSARLEKACPPGSILIDENTKHGVDKFIEVRLKKDLPNPNILGTEAESKLEKIYKRLSSTKNEEEKADLYYQLGLIYMCQNEIYEALDYLKQAVEIKPEDKEIKLAFAEATIKTNENEKIKVKGRKQRVSAYEVIGVKDALIDREKIPLSFYEKYHHATSLITIPEEIIMPIEAVDGCIGHSRVVATLAFAVASEFNIPEMEKKEILNAAFVADIGKEIVSHHLLNARSVLNTNDVKELQKHPTEGTSLLRNMGYDSELMLRIIRHSHEKFDGTGYPDGLSGENIPLGSRIISVADAYDAITSWRPYQEKWDRNAAFDELRKSVKNGFYDSQIVECLINLLS